MYLQKDNEFISIGNKNLISELPVGNYMLNENQAGLYLTRLEDFKLPDKIYGDSEIFSKRVIERYQKTGKSLGVALTGLKGSGKSLTAKLISKNSNLPVIIVNACFIGINFETFISEITKETGIVLFFDEFDKIYKNKEEYLLSLLDGTISHNCIFLFTSNSRYNQYLENRLSRIHYHIEYNKMELDTIIEVIDDLLINKNYKSELLSALSLIGNINLDLLISYISEINMFDESPLKVLPYLNISLESQTYDYYIAIDGVKLENSKKKENTILFKELFYFSIDNEILVSLQSNQDIYDNLYEIQSTHLDLTEYDFIKDKESYVFKLFNRINLIVEKSVTNNRFDMLKYIL